MLIAVCIHNAVDAPRNPREYTWIMGIISYPGDWTMMYDMWIAGRRWADVSSRFGFKEVFVAGNGDAGICILHGK